MTTILIPAGSPAITHLGVLLNHKQERRGRRRITLNRANSGLLEACRASLVPTRLSLRQIEEQDLRVLRALDGELLFVADRGAIALVEVLPVQFHRALGDLQPGVAALVELVLDLLPGLEQGNV